MIRAIAALAAALSVAGCAKEVVTSEETVAEETSARVLGSLTYREGIALPPGSVATVSLSDVSVAQRPAPVIAVQTIELGGRQPPIPFELAFDPSALDPAGAYAVRGDVHDAGGALAWTTDATHLIDPLAPETDLGVLTLIRLVSAEEAGMARVVTAGYLCGDAKVSMRFEGDQAQLTLDDAAHELFRAPAASGARYESSDGAIVFWEHGDVARLETEGRVYPECRKKGADADAFHAPAP